MYPAAGLPNPLQGFGGSQPDMSRPTNRKTPILTRASDILPETSGRVMQFAPNTLVSFGRGQNKIIGAGGMGSAYRATMAPPMGTQGACAPSLLSPIFVVKNNSHKTNEAENLQTIGQFGFTPMANAKQVIMKDGGSDLFSLMNSGPRHIEGSRVSVAPISMGHRRTLAKQLVECVKEVHESGLVHLDIKPENIVVNGNGKLALIDFGGSSQAVTHVDGVGMHPVKSYTPIYAAPEVLHEPVASNKADIWAMGMVMLNMELGLGKVAPLSDGPKDFNVQAYEKMIAGIKENPAILAETKAVLLACLKILPEERPSAQQLLNMPYFRERPIKELSVMELSVAHEAAFKNLAIAEQAVTDISEGTSLSEVGRRFANLTACQNRVKELQARIDQFSSGSSVLGRKYEPKWQQKQS